jgi:hypothetical protein
MTRDLEWHENKKLRRMEVAAPDMLDALRQWQYAERERDAEEMVNAKLSRDAAIRKATGAA